MAEFPRLFDDEPNQNQPLTTGGGLSALTQQTPSIMERVKQMQASAPPIEPERTLGGTLKDVALSAAKIPIGVGEMAVGLGSLATGGKFGKFMEEQVGYRPNEARQFIDQYYSPAQQAANQRVEQADGFVDTLVEGVKNPSVPFHSAIESLGYMGAGGAIARGIPLAAGKLAGSSALAGKLAQAGTTRGGVAGLSAAGEGMAVAGSQAENIRRQTADKELTPMQQLAAAGTGLIGAGIARGGQAVSDYFKVLDPDLWLAGGSKLALQQGIDTAKPIGRKAAALSLAKSVGDRADKAVKGYIAEGVFEEMPQEMFETFMENLALGKPLSEGVGESGALGLLSGGIMGGIAGASGPSLVKRQKIDGDRAEREAELAELDAAINQARTAETAQKVTPTGQPIPKATETSGPMGRAVNRSALPAPALGLGFNRAQTPPQMDGPIVFADGSTLSPYDFYQQRLEEHGDDALARQETFAALSGQDKAQASGGLLPLLPKDEVVTFNDGSFAKRSEIIDSLMQDGSTQEEAIQIADNLIAASRPQPEPTSYDLADYQAAQAARQLPLDLPTTQPGDTNEKALQTPNAETTETAAGQNAENVNWPQAVELDGIDYQLDGFKDTGEPIYVDPEQLAIMPNEDIERIFTEGNAYADNTGERATPDDTTATGADTGTGSDRRGTERTIGIDERGSLGSGIDATGRTTAGLGPVIDPNASIDRPSLTGTTELEQQPTATTDTPSQPISGTGEPNQSGVGEDGQVASSREAQIKAQEIDLKAQEAATSQINNLPQPTEAQKQAGNYKKGKVKAFGFDISIENPAGSERTGTDTDGETWRTTMSHHYGYIKRSKGADGDQVDVFIGPNADSQTAFVVEQIDPKTGKFDEHKVMLGFDNKADAEAAYRANYADDWQGLDKIIQMPLVSMKKRINEGKFTKPLKGKDVVEHAPDERVTATKDAVTTTQQNPILKQTKKGWVNQQLKSQQIKKTSPGYNEAVQRIEGQYEEELDKALAALPFEEFNNHPLNQNATESINRQAWESLRSAYEITDDANTQTKAQRLEDNQQIQPGQSVQTRPVRAGRGAGDMANQDAQTVTDKTATDPQQAGVVTDAKIADLPSVGTVTDSSTEVGPALREQTTNEMPVSWESPTVEDDNRWFGTRIEKKPQFKKELPIQGTVHRVYKGSSTGIIEFQPDGTDSVFRLRPDQISRVISISDSKQVSEKANDDQNNSGRTSVDADKPKTGRFNANSKHGGVDEQFRMANRGKKIAVLHGLNDKVGAYSREEIEGVAQENIDAVQDYLIKKYNEAKTPKGQPVQPNARADQAGNGQVDQSGTERSEVSSEEAQSQATDAELDKQERTLKRAITKAKNDLKNSKGTLEEKLKLKAKVKQAQDSLRDFRLNYFDNQSQTNDQSQNQAQKAEQQEAKEEVSEQSEFIKIRDVYGESHTVKKSDLDSNERTLLQRYDSQGNRIKDRLHRENILSNQEAPTPYFADQEIIGTKETEESPGGRMFKTHGAAKAMQNKHKLNNTHDVVEHHNSKGTKGFVLKKKAKSKEEAELKDTDSVSQNTDKPISGSRKAKSEQQELLEDSAADKIKADKDAAKPEVTQTKQQAKKAEVADEVKTGEAKAIEDFGEKLGGSRKDKAQSQNKISEFSDDEIANLPLSKIWPKESIDKIEDKSLAAIAHAFREVIPTKPQSSYKKRAWVEKVKTMKGFFDSIANSEEGQAITKEKVFKEMGQVATLTPVLHKIKLLENLEREQWGRIGEVRIVRMPYFYNKRVSETGMPGSQVSIDKSVETFLNITDINELAKAVNDAINSNPVDEKGGTLKFEIRTNYHSGVTFINKKGDSEYRHLKEFKSVEDARDYLKNNYVALAKAWEAVKERDNIKKTDVRRKENRPRTAQDWRKGKDVTVEQFQETFGFRGAEFGNWVSQGKNAKERQGMLNFAYDALMDLSSILEIPTQAISLDGSLGIGFGSRGSGAAAAHFEPGRVVINLTKTKGAGALAHEWFHALDNYFSRMRGGEFKSTSGETYRKENFVTYKPERLYVDKEYPTSRFTKKQLDIYAKTRGGRFARPELWIPDPKHKEGVRPVVEKAFADLVNALNESPMAKRALTIDKGKSEGYWSQIIERGARSFENYVIAKMAEQGYHNDYLANVTPYNEFARNPERYPYLLENELKPIVDAFDNLFKTMETRETDKGVALFSKAKKPISSDVTFGEFETGKPVTFDFAHNTESATDLFGKPKKGDRFKRDLEPSGRYVIQVPDASEVDTNKNTISGTLTFNNPLVLNVETWKEDLQRHYKKRGKALSNALIADGFDGVVTIDGKYGTSEILDLTTFDEAKAKYSRSDTSTNTHTAQSLTETIRRVMDKVYSGGWFDRLLSTGKFKVVTSDEAKLDFPGIRFSVAWWAGELAQKADKAREFLRNIDVKKIADLDGLQKQIDERIASMPDYQKVIDLVDNYKPSDYEINQVEQVKRLKDNAKLDKLLSGNEPLFVHGTKQVELKSIDEFKIESPILFSDVIHVQEKNGQYIVFDTEERKTFRADGGRESSYSEPTTYATREEAEQVKEKVLARFKIPFSSAKLVAYQKGEPVLTETFKSPGYLRQALEKITGDQQWSDGLIPVDINLRDASDLYRKMQKFDGKEPITIPFGRSIPVVTKNEKTVMTLQEAMKATGKTNAIDVIGNLPGFVSLSNNEQPNAGTIVYNAYDKESNTFVGYDTSNLNNALELDRKVDDYNQAQSKYTKAREIESNLGKLNKQLRDAKELIRLLNNDINKTLIIDADIVSRQSWLLNNLRSYLNEANSNESLYNVDLMNSILSSAQDIINDSKAEKEANDYLRRNKDSLNREQAKALRARLANYKAIEEADRAQRQTTMQNVFEALVKKEAAREKRQKFARANKIAKFWRDASLENDNFLFGNTPETETRLSDIIRSLNNSEYDVTYDWNGDDFVLMVEGISGKFTIHDADSDTPYIKSINAPSVPGRDLGSLLYQIAFAWAHNNDKTIVGDPDGITSINVLRRSFQMMSSALRYGTTKHMTPSWGQTYKGLSWGKGDIANISNLAEFITDRVLEINPALKEIVYNIEDGLFYKDGKIINDKEIQEIARSTTEARNSGIGLATAKVSVATNAIRQAQSGILRQPDGSVVEKRVSKYGRLSEDYSPIFKSEKGDVLAFYNPADDTTYFVADNISQNASDAEINGLMLHEVGVHAINLGRDSKEFQAILKQVEALAKTNEVVKQASARVPADTPAHLRSEETLGYLVEQNPDLPVVKRFLAWLRDTLRKIGMTIKGLERAKWIQWANKLNDADLVYMAQKALRKAADSLAFDGMQTGDAMASTAFDQPLKTKTPLPNGQQTVNVDGIERPALNSEGSPIHPYVEGIENFWRWFGDSVATDKSRRPKPLYHGTANDISIFEGFVNWFSHSPKFASEYADLRDLNKGSGANVTKAYLKSEAPFDADRLTKGANTVSSFVMEMVRQAKDRSVKFDENSVKELLNTIKQSARIEESGPHYAPHEFWMQPEYKFGKDGSDAIKKLFDILKFDSINFTEEGEPTIGVLDANQIKSATGNQGTFDPSNQDIRYSIAPPQQTPAWRRWFGNSKMVSAGQPITFYHGTNADFTVFDSEKLAKSTLHSTAQLGHFFTRKQGEAAQYGSRVHEVFLRIEKPYVVTSELLDKRMGDDPTRFAAKLKADGFDGLWIKDAGYAVVFDSNQVKLTENAAPSFADDIRYSKRANDQTVSQTVTGKPRVTKLKKMVRNLKDKARSNIYSLFGVDQMVDMAKHVLPSLSDYQELMTQRRTLQNNIMLEADRIVRNKWRTMDGDTQEALAKVMHDSTLNDFDPRLAWSELTDTPDGIEVMTQASLDQQAANKAAFDLGGSKVGFNRYRFPDNDRAEEFYDQLSELAFSDDAERAKAFSRVQAAYRALPEVAKEVFSETEATHEDLYQQKRQALEDRLLMAIADERKRSAYIDMLRLQFESNKMNWYYAPLSRFGDYWFYGTEADGEKVFSTFESVYALNEFRDSFLSEGGAEIGSGKKVQDMLGKNLNFEGVGEGFLADLNALLEDKGLMQADPDLQDEIYQMFLSTLPDVSMRKNSIHRKGVKGFEEDAMRSFAQAIWHGAKQLSNLKYNQDMLRELKRAESAIDLANSPNRLAQAKQDVAALDMLIEEWDTLGQAELEARAVLGFDQELYETALTYRKRYESMDEDAAIAAMRDEVADKQSRIKAAEQLGTDKEDTRFAADILTHLNKSYEDMQNPKFNSWAQFLMTTNFMTMLAFSPSTMIVNTLQTPNVAIPISYGQFGDLGMKEIAKEYTRTSKQFLESLAKDYRDFDNNHSIYGGLQAQHDEALKAGDTKLAERLNDELTAMKHWLLEGDISRTQAYDLIGVAETGYDYGGVGTRVKEIGGGVMHHSERFNREVTLLSNYRLGRRSGLSHNEAFRKARELNDRSHFNYSPENAPIVMRQPWSKLFFQFKKYQQNMLYVWGKSFADWTYGKTPQEIQQGRRTFLALAASQTMFAGALGFPAAGMLLALANMVGGLGGDDDDEPFDAEREIRLGLIDLFEPIMGEDAAKTASYSMTHGLFTGLTPVNISSRLSLRDTLFRDPPREFEGRDAGMYLVASLAGPTAGTIMNLYQGMDYAQEGEWMRAAESVMPKVLRDLLKAARYGTDDAKTLRGNVIKEMKASEVAWQALGFSSSELSKKYDEKKFVMQANTALTEARSKLIAKASEAQLTGDGEGYQQTMNKIRDWNRKHKEWPIKPDNIKQSIRSRQRVEQNMGNTGIYLNPKLDYLRDKFSL